MLPDTGVIFGGIDPPPTCFGPVISASLSESLESSAPAVDLTGCPAGGEKEVDGSAMGVGNPSSGPSPTPSPRPSRATTRPSFASSSLLALLRAALWIITVSQGCCAAAVLTRCIRVGGLGLFSALLRQLKWTHKVAARGNKRSRCRRSWRRRRSEGYSLRRSTWYRGYRRRLWCCTWSCASSSRSLCKRLPFDLLPLLLLGRWSSKLDESSKP